MDQKLQIFLKLLNLIDMSFTNNEFAVSFPENYVKEFGVLLRQHFLRIISVNSQNLLDK